MLYSFEFYFKMFHNEKLQTCKSRANTKMILICPSLSFDNCQPTICLLFNLYSLPLLHALLYFFVFMLGLVSALYVLDTCYVTELHPSVLLDCLDINPGIIYLNVSTKWPLLFFLSVDGVSPCCPGWLHTSEFRGLLSSASRVAGTTVQACASGRSGKCNSIAIITPKELLNYLDIAKYLLIY